MENVVVTNLVYKCPGVAKSSGNRSYQFHGADGEGCFIANLFVYLLIP